jgi:hypothetical protein
MLGLDLLVLHQRLLHLLKLFLHRYLNHLRRSYLLGKILLLLLLLLEYLYLGQEFCNHSIDRKVFSLLLSLSKGRRRLFFFP